MRKSAVYLWIMTGMLAGFSLNAEADIAFESPEDAMDYFIDEIKEGDIEGALKAFPIERASSEFKFDSFVDMMAGWQESYVMRYPSNSEVFRELNKYNLLANRMEKVTNFVFSFTADSMFLESLALPEKDSEIKDTMNATNANAVSEIQIVRMDYFLPEIQDNEARTRIRVETAERYGADNEYEYLVLYRLNDDLFYNAVTFIEYQGEYYLWELYGSLAALNTRGYVEATTELGYLGELER